MPTSHPDLRLADDADALGSVAKKRGEGVTHWSLKMSPFVEIDSDMIPFVYDNVRKRAF